MKNDKIKSYYFSTNLLFLLPYCILNIFDQNVALKYKLEFNSIYIFLVELLLWFIDKPFIPIIPLANLYIKCDFLVCPWQTLENNIASVLFQIF